MSKGVIQVPHNRSKGEEGTKNDHFKSQGKGRVWKRYKNDHTMKYNSIKYGGGGRIQQDITFDHRG